MKKSLVTLHDMAKMLETRVDEVLENAKIAGAIDTRPGDSNIYIDVNKYQDYLDTLIIADLKRVNGKQDMNTNVIGKVHNVKLRGFVRKVDNAGRLSLPKYIRDQIGFDCGQVVEVFVLEGDDGLLIKRV